MASRLIAFLSLVVSFINFIVKPKTILVFGAIFAIFNTKKVVLKREVITIIFLIIFSSIFSEDYDLDRVVFAIGVIFVLSNISPHYSRLTLSRNNVLLYFYLCIILFLGLIVYKDVEYYRDLEFFNHKILVGTYHSAWWLGLFLLLWYSRKASPDLYMNSIFFVFSVLSTGRSSVILGTVYFLLALYLSLRKSTFKKFALFASFVFVVIILAIIPYIFGFSKGLSERGLNLVARATIYDCYYAGLELRHLLTGFSPGAVAGECLVNIGRESVLHSRVMTESSLLSILSYMGIGSTYIFWLLFGIIRRQQMYRKIIFLIVFLRSLTGDFLFFTVWDILWISELYVEDR